MSTEISTPLFRSDSGLYNNEIPGVPNKYLLPRGEVLKVENDTVYWLKNGMLFRKLSYSDEQVICAVFTEFNYLEEISDRKAAVVFLPDRAYIYFTNGKSYTMSVPFLVKRAFSCQKGLILERDIPSDETYSSREKIDNSPKFFTMFDPILDLGLVVSSSTSAISPAEELAFMGSSVHSSICLTFNSREKVLNVYHTRFLSHSKSKTDAFSNRRHSSKRRSSSIAQPQHQQQRSFDGTTADTSTNNPSGGAESGDTFEQRLSISRSDITSTIDRMGTVDVGLDGINEFFMPGGLDISIMRKEVILTLLESIPCNAQLENLRVFSLVYQDQEALAILNRSEKSASIIFFNRPSGPVGVPNSEETYTFPALDIITVSASSDEEPCLLVVISPDSEINLFHPFLNIQSPQLMITSSWGQVRSLNSSYENNIMLETENAGYKSVKILLNPTDELTERCFSSLEMLLDPLSLEYLKFVWLGAVYLEETLNEWTAFCATILNCLVDFEDSFSIQKNNNTLHSTEDSILLDRLTELVNMNGIAYQVRTSELGTQFDFKDVKPFIVMCLHIAREELRLNISAQHQVDKIGLLLFWLVNLAGWDENWTNYYYEEEDFGDNISISGVRLLDCQQPLDTPPNIFETIYSNFNPPVVPFVSLSEITNGNSDHEATLIPRIISMVNIFSRLADPDHEPLEILDLLVQSDITPNILRQIPEGLQVPIVEILWRLKDMGNGEWNDSQMFDLLGRYDLKYFHTPGNPPRMVVPTTKETPRDLRLITQNTIDNESSSLTAWDGQSEADRIAISRLIFSEDRRFYEVSKLLQSSRVQVATLIPSPSWSEHEHLTRQQELFKATALRAFSVPLGRAALFYSARRPLATERYAIPKINFTLLIKPSNSTVSLQKMFLSDENVAWGYFHNGIAAGLTVSKTATYINGSWIAFNKPPTLTSQHAGFLLGLGLNGHLNKLEEWHIYNYLGPKHTHTSIALLIGMAASNLGSMNTKLTKVLSVHLAALLPVGSNDLNVSMLVQTAGLVGIGLLYYNTQHRRMTEILLSEISTNERNWSNDSKKDEGYRLAAGMSLGLVNLGKGTDLRGLNDMHIVERLLELAVVSKDVQTPELLDSAVPGSIIALAFVFMKTHNETVSRKIDVPDTEQRFDYIRPDFLLLRVLTKHLINWNDIGKTREWVEDNVPAVLMKKYQIEKVQTLDSDQMSYFNILSGLCLSIGLRYVSTGDEEAKSTLLHYLDLVMKLCETPIVNTDQKLVKRALLNVQCTIGLAVSAIMVGTGDLEVFRRLRNIYARTVKELPFGNHLANQMAMGLLFLGGGQYSLSDSNFSIACLVMAFYPLFPGTLQSNRAHIQVLRYFWVLAAESRCLVPREVTTQQPCNVDIDVSLKSGETLRRTAPCLIPQWNVINAISTASDKYHPIYLDFEVDPNLMDKMKADQNIYISKKDTIESKNSMLEILKQASATAVNSESNNKEIEKQDESRAWLSKMLSELELKKLEKEVALPSSEIPAESYLEPTVVDVKLVLEGLAKDPHRRDDLWNLKVLFAFADSYRSDDDLLFISRSTIERLKIELWKYRQRIQGE